jgi:hypothetical protein
MADRHSDAITGSGGSTGTPTSRTRASATLAGVRRNLFQSSSQQQQHQQHQQQHLSRVRRPGPSVANSSETLRADAATSLDGAGDSSEIVVRDRHGEIELGEPPAPDPEEDEEMAHDDVLERERECPLLRLSDEFRRLTGTSPRGETETG